MVHVRMFSNSRMLFQRLGNVPLRTCSNLSRTKYIHNTSNLRLSSSCRGKMDFLFCDYDSIGFDLDNTLCEYNLVETVGLAYDVMSDFLASKGHPVEVLKAPVDWDFLQRGLILDFDRGNVVKLDRNGGVMKATHGTKPIDRETIVDVYGARGTQCPLLNKIKSNLADAWDPECLSKYRLLLDYFDIPASLAFARCVDAADERGATEFNKCGEDVIAALRHMYNYANFPTGESGFFLNLKKEPEKYVVRCDPRLIGWLRSLRRKKQLFLITGSNCDLADFVARHSLGPDWRDLFDIVVCLAQKPFFFTERRSFKAVVDLKPGDTADVSLGGMYNGGNWAGLKAALRPTGPHPESRALYFGDNLVQDVFTPTKYHCCDTVAIVEEMNGEHPSLKVTSSSFWGPFHAEGSWWGNVIKVYPKAFLPTINLLAR